MIIDAMLEKTPGWVVRTGPDIGGTIPRAYGYIQYATCRKFYIGGTAWANWLNAVQRPILPNTGNLSLSFDFWTDDQAPLFCQCLEFDTIISHNKLWYNFSSQFNYSTGQWQIWSNEKKDWVNAGFGFQIFNPYQKYHVRIDYMFNFNTGHYSVLGILLDNLYHIVPSALQDEVAIVKNWTDGASVQIQQDLHGDPNGAFSHWMQNIQFEWS